VMNRRRWLRDFDEELDPMAGVANVVDAVLVFACGLIITIIVLWNLQGLVFGDMTEGERREAMQQVARLVQVKQGKELEEVPRVVQGEGEGYREMGTVYVDPETGKLIMVVRESPGTVGAESGGPP